MYFQVKIDEAIEQAQREELQSLADKCEIHQEDIGSAVQPIIDSCTKDAIQVRIEGYLFPSPSDQVINDTYCK